MGFFSRMLGRHDASASESLVKPDVLLHSEAGGIPIQVTSEVGDLHKVAGTTTFCGPDAQQVAQVLMRDHDGYLEDVAVLEHVAADESRPEAIDVVYGGQRIGALPSYATGRVGVPLGGKATVPVQLCAADTVKGPRLDVWVWLGSRSPRWEYSRQHRPPVTAKQRSAEVSRDTRATVREGLAEGGQRRADFLAGSVDGIHYLETVEPIKQLKREGQLEAALKLCYIGIQGAEKDSRFGSPAPWYTIQAAIIHRKLKQHDDEVAVLQRWLAHCPPDGREGSEVQQRLAKLQAKG